jgi:glycosyltransferase involved in cell wall biosynthesis
VSAQPRHVLLLSSALWIGGAERVIANLAKHLDQTKFRVTIGHLKERGAIGEELVARGFDVVGVPRPQKGLGKYLSFRNLARVVRERRIDLIHSHTTYSLTDSSLARTLALDGVKTVHTFHFGNYPHLPTRYKLLENVSARFATQLVSCGVEQGKTISATYGIAPARIRTIVNGVEPPTAAPDDAWREKLGVGRNLVIGTICVCSEQKGLPDLLVVAKAVREKIPDVRFVVVGHGPIREAMEKRAQEMGLGTTVTFTGWKENAGATMLPLFDVFFQPSLWEAMSMVVLEAMAAGKPIVATDVGDNRHVVLDGKTGYVVPRGDHAAMTGALLALAASPERRAAFGAAGKARYDESYAARQMARNYEALYAELLGGAKG